VFVRRRALIEVAGSIAAGESWQLRRGLLIALEDEEGRIGWGEASPLPGWSREEVATSRWALEALTIKLELEADVEAIDAFVREVPPVLASARFALETALYDLLAQRQGVSIASLLEPRHERLPLCQPYEEGDRLQAETIRVQAGSRTLDDELERLERMRATLGPAVKMRVHFDRAIPPLRLARSLERLEALDFELVEEAAPAELIARLDASPVPLALDESLLTAGELLEDLASRKLVRALVLRPMLVGGARVCMRLAEWAEQLGIAVTVAHSFDGPIAHAMSSAIALSLTGNVLPLELWPHSALELWGERELRHVDGTFIVRA
jgi:L-alanine-DL-glutamate epimerase-like enolase superfamily enzyme